MTKLTPHVFTNLTYLGKEFEFVRQAQDLANDYEEWKCSDIGVSVCSRYDGKKIVWFAQMVDEPGTLGSFVRGLNDIIKSETYSDAQVALDVLQQVLEGMREYLLRTYVITVQLPGRLW